MGADGARGPQGEPGPQGPGLTAAEVQGLIDAALAPVLAQLAVTVTYGDLVALQSSGTHTHEGSFLTAEQGGPEDEGEAFVLTGHSDVEVWESWTIARGTR